MARCVSLEMENTVGAVFEDNFFDLMPGQKRTVRIVKNADSRKVLVKALNAESVSLAMIP